MRGLRYQVVRYLAYVLELLVLSMLQQTPGLFPEIFGARPVIVIPAVLAISMYEPPISSMAFGIFGGLLIDFAAGGALGFHALFLAIICYVLAAMCRELIQANLLTMLLAGLICVGLMIVLQWAFFYLSAGFSAPGYAFLHHYLPRFVYTYLFVPILYLLNRLFARSIRAPGK